MHRKFLLLRSEKLSFVHNVRSGCCFACTALRMVLAVIFVGHAAGPRFFFVRHGSGMSPALSSTVSTSAARGMDVICSRATILLQHQRTSRTPCLRRSSALCDKFFVPGERHTWRLSVQHDTMWSMHVLCRVSARLAPLGAAEVRRTPSNKMLKRLMCLPFAAGRATCKVRYDSSQNKANATNLTLCGSSSCLLLCKKCSPLPCTTFVASVPRSSLRMPPQLPTRLCAHALASTLSAN